MKINSPRGKWFGRQQWSKILFVHWPVDKDKLQQYVPYPFRVMTYDNQAYLTVVAFRASESRFRNIPKMFSYRPFWQVNVRTYIRFGRECGVYFFTLYSNDWFAVKMGQLAGLPYVHSQMEITKDIGQLILNQQEYFENMISKISLNYKREDKILPDERLRCLTDHDRLYFTRGNKIFTSKISHEKWEFRRVTGQIQTRGIIDDMAPYIGEPILKAAENQESFLYPFQKIGYMTFD